MLFKNTIKENSSISDEVTIIIKTFERPHCLIRLMYSINHWAPSVPVMIADDSHVSSRQCILDNFRFNVLKYIELPFDSGLSAGRNELLKHVRTKYFLLCDDDFIFDGRTRLGEMLRLLRHHDVDLLGGECFDVAPLEWPIIKERFHHLHLSWLARLPDRWHGRPRKFSGKFETGDDGRVLMVNCSEKKVFFRCDYVVNFFMARTEVVQGLGGWNPALKLGEHEDFFLHCKQSGVRIGCAPGIGVRHIHSSPPGYMLWRQRALNMQPKRFSGN